MTIKRLTGNTTTTKVKKNKKISSFLYRIN